MPFVSYLKGIICMAWKDTAGAGAIIKLSLLIPATKYILYCIFVSVMLVLVPGTCTPHTVDDIKGSNNLNKKLTCVHSFVMKC